MTTGIVSIGPDGTVGRARELMLGLGVHCLPVVDGDESVIGFVTSADLVEEWPFGEPVSSIMSARVHAVDSAATVAEGAQRMIDERVHHLLVTDAGAPAGVISSFDMLAALVSGDGTSEC
jgi:CBS domain-containing protein